MERINKQLAFDFSKTLALDVSEAMIHYAKQRIQSSNVEFVIVDGIRLPIPDNSVDAVFSKHVFHHFDNLKDAFHYFSEIFRILHVNESIMFHIPIYRWRYGSLYRMIHNVIKKIGNFRAYFCDYLSKEGSGTL